MLSQSEQRLRAISLLTLIGGVVGLSVLGAVLFALYSARPSRRGVSAANAQLMHAARHDSLTDLSNRAHYRGTWVLQTACREAATWPNGIKVAVNLSAIQVESDHLANAVVNALAWSGLAADRLELEVTESIFLRQGPGPRPR